MKEPPSPLLIKPQLDRLYAFYNARKWVHPDPLEYLYEYPRLQDREVVGLIASCLAYGRVTQILKSVSGILKEMGEAPCRFLETCSFPALEKRFGEFKHRFTTGREMVMMLEGIRYVIDRYGSLYECFLGALDHQDDTILPALSFFVSELKTPFDDSPSSLLPSPEKGSACKRLSLFMRWMVRKDRVDPGGWEDVSPRKLIVPLDTHMHRISVCLNLTERRNSDMRTALEVTKAFRMLVPRDPVRYDFALTRLGIRKDGDELEFLRGLAISRE